MKKEKELEIENKLQTYFSIINILEMDTETLFKEIKNYFINENRNVLTDNQNYIFIDNNSKVLILSHLDTVGKEDVKIEINKNFIKNEGGVLGADDRAGVWVCLELYKNCIEEKKELPDILFTNFEESGGKGVKEFIKQHKDKLKEKRYLLMIEFDRCHTNDFVSYNGSLPKEIKDILEEEGFTYSVGSYSDIKDLTDETSFPSVNLSVCYFNQHSSEEKLDFLSLKDKLNNYMNILQKAFYLPEFKIEKYFYRESLFNSNNYKGFFPNFYNKNKNCFGYDFYDPEKKDIIEIEVPQCNFCGKSNFKLKYFDPESTKFSLKCLTCGKEIEGLLKYFYPKIYYKYLDIKTKICTKKECISYMKINSFSYLKESDLNELNKNDRYSLLKKGNILGMCIEKIEFKCSKCSNTEEVIFIAPTWVKELIYNINT